VRIGERVGTRVAAHSATPKYRYYLSPTYSQTSNLDTFRRRINLTVKPKFSFRHYR
ncbi:hypothetical protein BgiMline_032774, partial [Biomphalaria glabrata]